MHIVITSRAKRSIGILSLVSASGLLLQYWAFTIPPLPSGDADIGKGLIWLLGVTISVISGLVIVGLLAYALLQAHMRKRSTAAWLAILTVIVIIFVGWYVTLGTKSMQHSVYHTELIKRYDQFATHDGALNTCRKHPIQAVATNPNGGTTT